MTQLLFLSANEGDMPMLTEQPLVVDSLRSVSACHIKLGGTRDEFIKVKHWILTNQDDVEEMCATLNSWCFSDATPPLIFSFDALYVARRLAGYCSRRNCKFLPAVWWCGPASRCFDLVRYLSAGEMVEARELLDGLKIPVLPIYMPHKDAKQDLKLLLELSNKLNLINEHIDSAALVPIEVQKSAEIIKAKIESKTKSRTVKQLV
jgi:hypothetical protein